MLRILFAMPLCFAVASINATPVDSLHPDPVAANTCPLDEAGVELPYCFVPSDLSGNPEYTNRSVEHLKKEHVN